jgi:hypothetical protein
MLADDSWFTTFGAVTLVRREDFGLIQERRLRRDDDGLEIEIGIGGRDWATIDPIDAGTARVVRDGMCTSCSTRNSYCTGQRRPSPMRRTSRGRPRCRCRR